MDPTTYRLMQGSNVFSPGPQWGLRIDTPLVIRDTCLDSAGNSYVCGWVLLVDGLFKYSFVLKYNPNGVLEWGRMLAVPTSNASGGFYAVAVDSTLNVYLSHATGLVKYNSSGTLLWQVSTDLYSATWDLTRQGLCVTSAGDIYHTTVDINSKLLLLKYSTDGVLQYCRRITGNKLQSVSSLADPVLVGTTLYLAFCAYSADNPNELVTYYQQPLIIALNGPQTAIEGNLVVLDTASGTSLPNSYWNGGTFYASSGQLYTMYIQAGTTTAPRLRGIGTNNFTKAPSISAYVPGFYPRNPSFAVDQDGNSYICMGDSSDYNKRKIYKVSPTGSLLYCAEYKVPGDAVFAAAVSCSVNSTHLLSVDGFNRFNGDTSPSYLTKVRTNGTGSFYRPPVYYTQSSSDTLQDVSAGTSTPSFNLSISDVYGFSSSATGYTSSSFTVTSTIYYFR